MEPSSLSMGMSHVTYDNAIAAVGVSPARTCHNPMRLGGGVMCHSCHKFRPMANGRNNGLVTDSPKV